MEKRYTIKPIHKPSVQKHSVFPPIKVSANYANIPIEGENWSERSTVLLKPYEDLIDKVIDFKVHDDDVFVVSFMKAGTTWIQEMAWLLLNDLDFEGAKLTLMMRSPFLEMNATKEVPFDLIEYTENLKGPRLVKTHLPSFLLPKELWEKKPKIIYIARNIKDVMCSAYHFINGMNMWHGTFDECIDEFLNNELYNTPYWEHVLDFWKLRNEPNIFFVTYEEMQSNLPDVIQRLSTFLGKPEITELQMKKFVRHLSFKKMKENRATNFRDVNKIDDKIDTRYQFMRRGIVGSYKDEMTPALQKYVDKYSAEFLSPHGLKEKDIFVNEF